MVNSGRGRDGGPGSVVTENDPNMIENRKEVGRD